MLPPKQHARPARPAPLSAAVQTPRLRKLGIARDSAQARQLLASAAQAKYPRAKLDLSHIDFEEGKAGGTDLKALTDYVTRAMMPPGEAR